jgi:hypothetical protein
MMPLLALSLSTANYGPDAMLFKPQRWMPSSSNTTTAAPAGDEKEEDRDQQQSRNPAAAGVAGKGGSSSSSMMAPDPHTFMTGGRGTLIRCEVLPLWCCVWAVNGTAEEGFVGF